MDDQTKRREELVRAADRLREQTPRILLRWAEVLRSQEPFARGLDDETIRNNLPLVLEQTAAVLGDGTRQDVFAYAHIPAAKEHAAQRAAIKGFTLDLVMKEYHLLRRTLIEVMEEDGTLSSEVVRILNDAVDRAMQEAAVFFVAENQRARDEQERVRRALTQQLMAGQEEERQRISRDLHDGVGHLLTVLSLQLQKLEPLCLPGSSDLAVFRQAQASVKDVVQELHRVSRQLRPLVLDDLGLCPALGSFLEETERHSSIRTALYCSEDLRTAGSHIDTVLFRVAQEAVTNAVRHAKAKHVSIHVEQRPGELRLIVEDDGCGFEVDATVAATKRLGLRGMRERIELVGGDLDIESSSGSGTTLFVRVPLRSRAGEESAAARITAPNG